tara:strand:- start:273 stop:638 length:366 start_codon:yes stop_codon:yes gene_type:complete
MDVENIVNDVPIEEPAKDITSTKPKNSKRVEQGQRLAEWNRKNKLQKQKQNDSPKSNSPIKKEHTENNYWFLGGTIVVGGLVVGSLYFIQRGAEVSTPQPPTPQPPTPQPPTPQTDPFDMA